MGPLKVDLIVRYFLNADQRYLKGMGVEPEKLPQEDEWRKLLFEDLDRSVQHKKFYYLIWELDGSSVGHSNINKIAFGSNAFMHLHLWDPGIRRGGLGTSFIMDSISRFFIEFDLQFLFCEPYALNPAPNRVLEKVGFDFVKKYETVPGWINFRQEVNRWVLTRERWLSIWAADNDDMHADASPAALRSRQ